MLEIRCPKCDGDIEGFAGDYISWRSDRRRCPKCGTELALSNSFICYGLCALIFGGLFTGLMLNFAGRGLMWFGLGGAIVILWVILPVVVRLLGRWRTVDDARVDKASGWLMVVKVSRIVLLAAVAVAFVSLVLQYRHVLDAGWDLDSESYSREGVRIIITPATVISGGAAVVVFCVYIFARVMRWKTSISAKQRELAEGLGRGGSEEGGG